MDSDEDSFIRLPSQEAAQDDSLQSLEQLRREIERCKELYSVLEQDNAKLQMAKEAAEKRTQELKNEEPDKIFEQQMPLKGDVERTHQIHAAKEENNRLRQEKQVLKNKLEELQQRVLWSDPVMMPSALPEKNLIFKGLVVNKKDMNKLMLTPLIHYPLPGGSALITFEEASVAQRIIEMREHVVELSCGEELEKLDWCRMRVQAVPVEIMLPSALEMRLTQSSRSILVSDLPSLDISKDDLLDKVELFFSKTKNGGSEVESREFLDDSGVVVLTFTQHGVAERLIQRGHIKAFIKGGEYNIKISPCMNGDITDLQFQPSCCPRTVLISGIPDVLSEESMRDTLEIHFQKASRGGGEVDSLAYIPAGRTGVAVFVEDRG